VFLSFDTLASIDASPLAGKKNANNPLRAALEATCSRKKLHRLSRRGFPRWAH